MITKNARFELYYLCADNYNWQVPFRIVVRQHKVIKYIHIQLWNYFYKELLSEFESSGS
ncbi:hypothetical protein LCGC14_1214520 [marine sediment metagenome]|uniref:Uncharacterized protein n=1 Tax=marine sediment metagenome TaxID=412755 RepID=A0A0F9LHA1_9ZZZZ